MDTDRPRGTSDPDMHPVRAALSQFSVHAPFTAHEAYAACAASRPSGANMEEILEDRFPQGNDGAASSGLGAPTTGAALPPCAVPQRKAARDTASRTSLRQRKNQGDDPTALPPHAAAFQAALEQVGILPLPDSVPSEAASSPGTKDLRSQAVAAGWRMTGNMFPSSQFEARLADWATAERAEGAAATSGNDDSATALGWSSAGQRSYRLASLRYQVPCRRPLESGAESDGAAAAARASARVVHAGTRGLGGGMVVAPAPTQVESGNAVHGASSGITMQGPAKAPSAKVRQGSIFIPVHVSEFETSVCFQHAGVPCCRDLIRSARSWRMF